MSKLIFYFFTIIFFVILFNLVSGAPKQTMNTKDSIQPKSVATTEDTDNDDQEEEEEEEEEVDEPSDILYDDPIEMKKLAITGRKSNGIRMHMDRVLFIGFIFSICSLR